MKTKEEKILNKIINKLNAIQGHHKINHIDGMGNINRTVWFYGSSQRAPLVKKIEYSSIKTSTVTKYQINNLEEILNELKKSKIPTEDKESDIKKVRMILSSLKKETTEYQLLKLLKTKSKRKRHTSKHTKHLTKQLGRKRFKEKKKK